MVTARNPIDFGPYYYEGTAVILLNEARCYSQTLQHSPHLLKSSVTGCWNKKWSKFFQKLSLAVST